MRRDETTDVWRVLQVGKCESTKLVSWYRVKFEWSRGGIIVIIVKKGGESGRGVVHTD